MNLYGSTREYEGHLKEYYGEYDDVNQGKVTRIPIRLTNLLYDVVDSIKSSYIVTLICRWIRIVSEMTKLAH